MRTVETYESSRGPPIVLDRASRLKMYDRKGILAEVLVSDDQNSNDHNRWLAGRHGWCVTNFTPRSGAS